MTKITHDQLIEKGIFDEAINGAKTLRKEYEKLYKELQKQIKVKIDTQQAAPANSKLGQDLIKQTAKEVGALEKVVANYQKQIGRTVELQKQLTAAQQAYNSSSAETRRAILREAEILKQKTEAERLDIKVLSQKEGTLGRLRAELAKQKSILVNDTKMNTKGWDDQVKKVNDLNNTIKKAEASMGQYQRNVGNYPTSFLDKIKASWVAIGAAIAVATAAMAKIVGFFSDAAKEAMAVQTEQNKLLLALNGNIAAFDRMNSFATEMEQLTLFEDKDILRAQQMSLALGRTEEETNKMVTVAMALSRVTGTDLQSSMIQLQGTFEGSTGRLAKFAGEIKDLSAEELKSGKAIDLLYDKIGRFATQGLNTAEGRITMFQKAIGNLKEAIGNLLLPAITAVAKGITAIVDKMTEWFSMSKSDSIRQQRDDMESLVTQITSLNEGNKTRKELLDELVSKYPEFFSQIEAEKVKNEELLGMLNDVNEAYEKRIQLAVYGEELAGYEKSLSSVRDKQKSQLKEIIEYYRKYIDISKQKPGATVDEMIASVKEVGKKEQPKGSQWRNPFKESESILATITNAEAKWNALTSQAKIIETQIKNVTSRQKAYTNEINEEEAKSTQEAIRQLEAKKNLTKEEEKTLNILKEKERVRIVTGIREKVAGGTPISSLPKDEQKLLKQDDQLRKQQEKAVADQLKTDEKYLEVRKKMNRVTVLEEVAERKQALVNEKVWQKMSKEEQDTWEIQTTREISDERSANEIKTYEEAIKKQKEDREAAYQFELKLGLKTWEEIYAHTKEQYTSAKEFIEANPIKQKIMLEKIEKIAWDEATKSQKKLSYDETQEVETTQSFQPDYKSNTPSPPVSSSFDVFANFDFQDKLSAQLGKIQAFASAVQGLLGAISNSYQQQQENDLAAVEKRYNKEYESLDTMLNNKTINEKEYNKRKTELDKKKEAEADKIKREYAKKQKQIAIIQAIINTAVGVTTAIAQGGGVFGLILGAIVAAAGAIEIATISNQQFAKGGHGEVGKKGTILKGRRHSEGGVQLPGIGEAEAGEYFGIISRPSTRRYKRILPRVFESLNKETFENEFIPISTKELVKIFDRESVTERSIHPAALEAIRMQQIERNYQKNIQPIININVEDKWNRKIYEEMKKSKPIQSDQVVGDKIYHREGNHTVITNK